MFLTLARNYKTSAGARNQAFSFKTLLHSASDQHTMAWNNSHSWLSRKISFLKKHFIKAHAFVRLFPVAVHISQDCSLWRQKRIQRWQESHPACICPNHQLCFWFSCSLDCQLQHSEQGRVVLKMLCKQRERKTNHSGARAAWSGKAPGILMERESVWCLQHSQIWNCLGRWGNEQSSSCKAGGFFFSYFGTKP